MQKEKNSTNTKEKIRECALELFKEQGYDNVTIVQICKSAGVTKRTFYYHYESKDELLYGLTDYIGEQAEQLLDSLVSQQTNVGMLWELMSVYCIHSEKYGPKIIARLYIHILQGGTSEDFPYSTYLYKTVVRTIQNAQLAGEIHNKSTPEEIAFTLYHAFRSVMFTWAAASDRFDLEGNFRKVFDVILGITNTNT